ELHGLVGHWKFDEGSGITAADSTAFGNNATLYGATWTNSCEGGNAIEFDGVGGIASTDADFCPPATGSVAMWLRSAGNPGSRSRPFGNGGNWEVRQEPDGTLSFDLGGEGPDVGAGGDEFVTTEGLSFEDRWYHVVAQFDADDESFEIYIDGSLVHSGTNGDDMTEQAANILSFGTRTGSTEYWEGGMRDFRVYNRWLAAGNIAEIYGSLGHWKLDETSGTVATDSSGAGNDGAYVASPTLGVTSRYPVKLGTAVEFDGTNRMEVPGRLSEPANVTIAAWAKLDAADAGGAEVISIGNSFALRMDDFNNLVSFIYNGTDYDTRVTQSQSYQGTGWHHFAAVFNDTDDLYELYVDGILVDTISTPDSISWTDAPNTTIGAHAWADGNFDFSGSIDDVRVFGRALCAADVYNVYRDFVPAGVRIKSWVETR
ncbi:MAG: LamG domain-containing protein, partial [Lacipirellulaceae bacterium]